jgi:hypothetical protein
MRRPRSRRPPGTSPRAAGTSALWQGISQKTLQVPFSARGVATQVAGRRHQNSQTGQSQEGLKAVRRFHTPVTKNEALAIVGTKGTNALAIVGTRGRSSDARQDERDKALAIVGTGGRRSDGRQDERDARACPAEAAAPAAPGEGGLCYDSGFVFAPPGRRSSVGRAADS